MDSVLGIIFANSTDAALPELTAGRCLAALPVGGRYRLIDFALANLVNAGVTHIGVVANRHYQALMEHLGSGKDWDLSRRSGGLVMLPPYCCSASQAPGQTRLQALQGIVGFIAQAEEEYVLLTDSDMLCSLPLDQLMAFYQRRQADIVLAYHPVPYTQQAAGSNLLLTLDSRQQILDMGEYGSRPGPANLGIHIWLLRRRLLLQLVEHAAAHGQTRLPQVLTSWQPALGIYGYRYTGYYARVDCLLGYYRIHMQLLAPQQRAQLLQQPGRPVYTRAQNTPPTRYGPQAVVQNALIADGCTIEGQVENSVLFRNVRVAPDSRVANSVIMPHGYIAPNVQLDRVIADRGVVIRQGARLAGEATFPLFIGPHIVV